jgi:DNA gyrase subunit B
MTDENTQLSDTQSTPSGGTVVEGEYSSENVQIFRDTAHIRQRPGMYIGDTSHKGLHQLVYELVYNSVDEALAGHCRLIHVKTNVDGSLSVSDDGRGIPVDEHPEAKRPTLEVVMTTVGAGAKFDKNTYKVSAGLHGIGAKAVTALSEWVEAEVRRDGKVYTQEYERGKPITEVAEIGITHQGDATKDPGTGRRTGTRITFKPDPEVFKDVKFDYDTLEVRLRELAFLNKGLAIKLSDEGAGKEELFKYDGGIAEFVEYLNRMSDTLHKPVYVDKTVENVRVEVAFQYTTDDEERVRCYANNAYNSVGGTHLSGFRAALTRALNSYGTKENLFKNVDPIGEDFREGLTAIVSVQVPEPQLEAQTKIRLNNPEVEGYVATVVNEALSKYLEENPKDAQKIMKKVTLAAEAREAAAKAKKDLKSRKSLQSSGQLPGKLYDCTNRDRDEAELFLVEGQSAGGSAESGRNRMFQAILPLRGKVLNVEKARQEKVLSNEEICNLISAVGIDIGNSEDISKRRYDKLVILTDADVDGQHIRTLLLTFFYRQMKKLIDEGHIFVARPPLYKVTHKKSIRYVQSMDEMNRELMDRGLSDTKVTVLPLPEGEATPGSAGTGAGEASAAVFDGERLAGLVRVLSDMEEALVILERRGLSLRSFLTRAGAAGLPTYRVYFGGHEHWFSSAAEVDAFRRKEQERLGHDLVVGEELRLGAPARSNGNSQGNGSTAETFFVQELHEVRGINKALERLRELGLGQGDLVPLARVAGREPPVRFVLEHGDIRRVLPHLRELAPEVRKLGERGMTIIRFKGLGEMDGEELWETTLDPAKRTLMKVQMDDALKADEMFRTLMGEKVEPRRDFIQKHALEAKDIDYHGA